MKKTHRRKNPKQQVVTKAGAQRMGLQALQILLLIRNNGSYQDLLDIVHGKEGGG